VVLGMLNQVTLYLKFGAKNAQISKQYLKNQKLGGKTTKIKS